ncbi:guanine deaminase [Consotaella salsifontis]|uniref:Guanine deaminase n=1 Tax=Consotaella salsifontis TaxID=1365950 RepID=A0A1T4SR12_9HYPH|nr:guanine deaminase [Consotaella salsifontis]SKA30596.1 guanine deaminase [Consotaella salsifontis]
MTKTRGATPPTSLAIRGRLLSFEGDPAVEGPSVVRFWEDGTLVVANGLIEAIGESGDMLAGRAKGLPLADHRPHLVMAGFVDPHLHMPQTQVIASFGTELMEWLQRYTFPEESRYGDPAVAAAGSRFLLDELLRNGTTSAAVYCTSHPQSVDAFFGEAERRGLRMVAGKVMMDRGAPEALLDTPQRGYEESKALIARWHGRGRLSYAITPRFAPTSTEAQLEATAALAAEFPDLHVQTHLSENEGEIAFVREAFPWSKDYTEVYERYGLVREKALFGHCIHLSDRERTALAAGGASAIFCPTSNLFLGSGLFDLEASRAAGIKTGIATDIGGGTSYSMLRTAAEGYKVLALKGEKLPPLQAFHMMTAGNAAAMGLGDKIGRLSPGYEADIVVLDSEATPAQRRRMERVETLGEELFCLMTMGDDRSIVATYAGGRLLHERDKAPFHPLEAKQDAPPPPSSSQGGEAGQ